MSTQAYTNKRRILAEASLRKVQYPGSIGLNNTPLYASINCNPDFNELTYSAKTCCTKVGSAPPGLSSILDGGNGRTLSTIVLNGGNATTNSNEIFDGGNS